VCLRLEGFNRDTQVAVRAARDAVRLARSLEGHTKASTKRDESPVTVADLAIQAIVTERLWRVCPNDSVIAEEDTSLLTADRDLAGQVLGAVRQVVRDATTEQVLRWIGSAGSEPPSRFWTIDPIDGTKGFLHGRQYIVALALIVDGSIQTSVIGCPRLLLGRWPAATISAPRCGGVAIAARGQGAWWTSLDDDICYPLAVSTRGDVSVARVVQSFEGQHGDPARFARVLRSFGSLQPPVFMDSQAKHVTVAAGDSDLLMRFPPHDEFHDAVWDQAAGALLVEEAGGRVTDLAGQPLDFTSGRRLVRNTGMLASNGLLHEAALDAVRRAT
jgi:3'(2'), 5'-bisphosphate nucleotidase